MSDFYLSRTPSSGGNQKTFTVSTWCKLEYTNNEEHFLGAGTVSTAGEISMCVDGGEKLMVMFNVSGTEYYFNSAQVLRDYSSWYHFVIAVDTTQGSASDRMKMYINGSIVTAFTTDNRSNITQNYDFSVNSTSAATYVGRRTTTTGTGYYKGYLAQTILVDGAALTPSSFGSTNANGIWIPNTSPSVTYGTNGFKLEYKGSGTSADSSGFGADTSGNNNHLAVSGSIGTNPNTNDGPANNFSVMSPMNIYPNNTPIITEGGLKTQSQSTSGAGLCSTIAVSAGKWYAEGKIGSGSTLEVGAVDIGDTAFNQTGTATNSVGYDYGGNIRVNNSNTQTSLSTYTGGDIIGIALNMDTATGTVTFYKNGSAVGSAQNFTTSKPGFAAFYMQSHTSGGNQSVEWYFGNPTFTIASGNADANGYGNFEYAVPSGYYALCTKNLALYGG